jgi:hypothetical protein
MGWQKEKNGGLNIPDRTIDRCDWLIDEWCFWDMRQNEGVYWSSSVVTTSQYGNRYNNESGS